MVCFWIETTFSPFSSAIRPRRLPKPERREPNDSSNLGFWLTIDACAEFNPEAYARVPRNLKLLTLPSTTGDKETLPDNLKNGLELSHGWSKDNRLWNMAAYPSCPGNSKGKSTMKLAPWSFSLSMRMSPPMQRASILAPARPRPCPRRVKSDELPTWV